MNLYLDSSVPLRILLAEPGGLAQWDRWTRAFASELVTVETRRTLDRYRLQGRMSDARLAAAYQRLAQYERGFALLPLRSSVILRARMPMNAVIGTLDAIHLASALIIRDGIAPDLVFATHDRQQATAARALGLDVIGVEA